jgi:hypothetical protein
MKFINFDLRIENRTADGHYPVAANNDAGLGQGRSFCKIDPASPEITKALDDVAADQVDADSLKKFGALLGTALLNGDVEDKFNEVVGMAKAQTKTGTKTGVRLRLWISPPELHGLPWELARMSPDDEPLAISTDHTLARYLEVSSAERDLTTVKPIRMLGIIPQGSGLDVEKEKEALTGAVSRLGEAVQLKWLEGIVNTERVRDELGEAEYHILHFIGHGTFKNDVASLQLNDEWGDPTSVSAERFAGLLRNHQGLRLVVLNACRGAARSSAQAMIGVAPQVVQKGVPAVVAMQWDFNDQMAARFGKAFYRSLCIGPDAGDVDTALANGRSVLYDEYGTSRGFATPVLFFRSDSGKLWKSEADEQEEAEQKEAAEGKAAPVTNISNVQTGGVQIGAGANISVGSGDVVFGNKTTAGGNIINAGPGASVSVGDPAAAANLLTALIQWETQMKIKAGTLKLSAEDKKELIDQLVKIRTEAGKGAQVDPGRLEKLVNTLGVMAPDIFEVAVTTLANPLAGIGLAMKKIGDKAKVERTG